MKRQMNVLAVTTIIALGLVGCGSKQEAATTAAPAQETTKAETTAAATEASVAVAETTAATSEKPSVTITSMDKTQMSFGNTQPDDDVESIQLVACADTIKKATNGNFDVEVFTNSALGDTDDILEQAVNGAAVLTVTDPGRLADYIPEYGILQMPYIMKDYTQIDAITGTDTVAQWEKDLEQYGVKVLTSNWYGGARHFVCNKEVNKPEDLKGLKIRTMGSDICIESVNAMGAVGTAMPQSQIYSGIEQKALDGCENQSTSTYASRLYEICKYINKTGHFVLLGCPATGTTYFNSLPEDYQQLLTETFRENGSEYQSVCAKMEVDCEKEMADKYGVTIHDLDATPFKEAVESVYTKLGYEDLRTKILTEAGLQ